MTVQENREYVAFLKRNVRAHHMCFQFEEDQQYYRVLFPEGFYPDGVQCLKSVGKAEALERILLNMEKVWKESQL